MNRLPTFETIRIQNDVVDDNRRYNYIIKITNLATTFGDHIAAAKHLTRKLWLMKLKPIIKHL